MANVTVTPCAIAGLFEIEPTLHTDARGYFMETYNQRDLQQAGLTMRFVQDNQSMSCKGVLRGLHFQKQYPQGKLVRVIRGRVFDVAVDLRPGSETFGRWHGVELSAANHKQLYIRALPTAFWCFLTKRSFATNAPIFTTPATKAVLPGTTPPSAFAGLSLRANTGETRWQRATGCKTVRRCC